MEVYKITAVPRDVTGKSAMRKLRVQGLVPSNIYGTGEKNIIFSLKDKDLQKLVKMEYENIILEIKIGNKEFSAIIKDLQADVVTDKLLHIDFQHVRMGKSLKLSIPVHLEGESEGAKEGGIVEHFLREIEVECLPKDIPKEFLVDVSALQIGGSIHVSDIAIQEGISILESSGTVICSVVLPAKAIVEEVEEEEVEGEEGEGEGTSEDGKVEKEPTSEK